MGDSTGASAPRSTNRTMPARPARASGPTRPTRRVLGAVAAAGVAVTLAVGCSSSGPTDTVSAGPVGTANPETPAADNPTTSGPSTTASGFASSTTTTDPDAAASTSTAPTTDTSVPPAVPVTSTPPTVPSVTAQIFWVRAPGDARVIDIPGYRDPETGPLPLVLYGSVTNDGTTAVANPYVTASWLDAGGATVSSFTAAVLGAGSTEPLSTLAPGQSGDVIVVVTDPDLAERLGTLVPSLAVGSR